MAVPVFVIDDNEDDLYFTNLVLERCDVPYEPKTFAAAQDALAWLSRTTEPRSLLILLDINMPGMDGFEFLRAFETLPTTVTRGVSIVMLTSSADPDDQMRSAQFKSVRGYLTKPLGRQAAAGLVKLLNEAEGSAVF